MKKFFLLTALLLLAGTSFTGCVYRGFGAYASTGDGNVIRQGSVLYLPWPVLYEQFESCEMNNNKMVCKEIHFDDDQLSSPY